MKKLITTCFMLITSFVILAQTEISFGPKVGLNVANCTNSHMYARVGIHLGAFSNIRFNDYIALQPEFLFSMQGCQKNNVINKYNYFNIPFMVKAYLYKGINIGLGPQLGFLVNPRVRYKEAKITQDIDNMKTFDFSIGLGIGYETEIGFLIDARYNISATKLSKHTHAKNSVFAIGIGWKF